MKKILVIGATGMLGHKLCQLLPDMGFEVAGTIRRDVNSVEQFDAVFAQTRLIGNIDVMQDDDLRRVLSAETPDFVINCVGVVKQRKDVENKYLSVGINAWLPHRLEKLCGDVGAKLIHISTDCVFDGVTGGYRESDPTNAQDLYGLSKCLGETDENETNAVTLRTSIIGRQLVEPKLSLVEWFLRQNGTTIKGFDKAIYTGITTHEMARVIKAITEQSAPVSGVYHVASPVISKYDLLLKLRDAMGLEIEIERDTDFACDRSLVMERFTELTGYQSPDWDQMLAELAADTTPYDEFEGRAEPLRANG